MRICMGMSARRGRFRRAWFYWWPRAVFRRPDIFSNWSLSIFWLCFHIHAEGGGKGLA